MGGLGDCVSARVGSWWWDAGGAMIVGVSVGVGGECGGG